LKKGSSRVAASVLDQARPCYVAQGSSWVCVQKLFADFLEVIVSCISNAKLFAAGTKGGRSPDQQPETGAAQWPGGNGPFAPATPDPRNLAAGGRAQNLTPSGAPQGRVQNAASPVSSPAAANFPQAKVRRPAVTQTLVAEHLASERHPRSVKALSSVYQSTCPMRSSSEGPNASSGLGMQQQLKRNGGAQTGVFDPLELSLGPSRASGPSGNQAEAVDLLNAASGKGAADGVRRQAVTSQGFDGVERRGGADQSLEAHRRQWTHDELQGHAARQAQNDQQDPASRRSLQTPIERSTMPVRAQEPVKSAAAPVNRVIVPAALNFDDEEPTASARTTPVPTRTPGSTSTREALDSPWGTDLPEPHVGAPSDNKGHGNASEGSPGSRSAARKQMNPHRVDKRAREVLLEPLARGGTGEAGGEEAGQLPKRPAVGVGVNVDPSTMERRGHVGTEENHSSERRESPGANNMDPKTREGGQVDGAPAHRSSKRQPRVYGSSVTKGTYRAACKGKEVSTPGVRSGSSPVQGEEHTSYSRKYESTSIFSLPNCLSEERLYMSKCG
jgi:hypothetical protein